MSRKGRKISNTKKFIIIGVIAALVASTLVVVINPVAPNKQDHNETKAQFCGSGIANSNKYIQEYVLPTACAEPVGITVGADGTVWFAESAARKIGKFDPDTKEFKEYTLPGEERTEAAPIASIWTMKFDRSGKLWFPDVVSNSIWKFDPASEKFEKYRLPSTSEFGTSYPINLDFDDNGRIWFSEIYGKNIGMLDPSSVKPNTSEGIREIPVMVDLETLGPLAFDNDGNIWFTALTYPATGKLMKFNPDKETFSSYTMPSGIFSPVGIAPDGNGNLWINDHGTSAFIRFNPNENSTVIYTTSLPSRATSIGLYERCLEQPGGSAETCAGYPVSLPYWNMVDDKGRVWFNEHQGNSLAVFDPRGETLTEYFVPTQNIRWGDCEQYLEPCGISNPLQFTLAPDGKVWFTEWTESKIGVLDPSLALPFSIDTAAKSYIAVHGEPLAIDIAVNAKERLDSVEMRVSGTIIPSGRLYNVTAEFSEQKIEFNEPGMKNVILKLVPDNTLVSGDYSMTISAKYREVTVSKIVQITVQPGRLFS
jgi:virginiamycin B lyase